MLNKSALCVILTIALFGLPASTAWAATSGKGRIVQRDVNEFQLGFIGGMNLTTYSIDPPNAVTGMAAKVGFVAGAFCEIPLGGSFFLEPELRYALKGFNSNNGLTGLLRLDYSLTTSHLEIPVLAKYQFFPDGPIRLALLLGPNFMIRTGGSIRAYDAAGQERPVFTPSIDDFRFKSFDLGIDFGVGANFYVSDTMSILGQVRFTLGLLNEVEPAFYNSAMHRSFQFLTGMSFAL